MDSINKLLKDFPDKWLLMVLFLVVFGAYLTTHADFLGQLAQTILGAILGIIGVRRYQSTDATTSTGDIQILPPDGDAATSEGGDGK